MHMSFKNISQLSEMLDMDRATVRKKLERSGLKPTFEREKEKIFFCPLAFLILFDSNEKNWSEVIFNLLDTNVLQINPKLK